MKLSRGSALKTSLLGICFVKAAVLNSPVGAEGCPDCSKIRCADTQLGSQDCPAGTILTDNVLFGCCPACLKYLEYGSPCPGLFTQPPIYEKPLFMKWGEYDSTNGVGIGEVDENFVGSYNFSRLYYPNEFIRDTVSLPCSNIEISYDLSLGGSPVVLPERVFSAYWTTSPRNVNLSVPVIKTARCSPNLRCFLTYDELETEKHPFPKCLGPLVPESEKEFVNYVEESFSELPCTYRSADYSAYNSVKDCSVRYWDPACDHQLGTFSPVQQKSSDANYFCSTPQGERLAGQERSSLSDPEIDCLCSRKHWEIKQSKKFESNGISVAIDDRPDVSLHCKTNGNFEMLQCDKGMCWCIAEKTGRPLSKILPESLIKFLPCFDRLNYAGKIGSKYLRKCDSRLVGIERTSKLLRERGILWQVNQVLCDLAGGFDKTFCDDKSGICNCVSSSKRSSPTSFANNGLAPASTCSCARDFLDGLTGTLHCDGYGNYPSFKSLDGPDGTVEFCSDARDGWRVSGEVDTNDEEIKPCCLDTNEYPIPDWMVSPEEYRPSYSCRPFDLLGCDNSEDCLLDLKSCNNF